MADYIEGRRAVAEALKTQTPMERALTYQSRESDPKLDKIVDDLIKAGVRVEQVDRRKLDEISSHGAHQGIMVAVRPFNYATVEDVIRNSGTGDSLVIICDHLTDEGNLGAIIRTAEICGAAGVIIPAKRSAQVTAGVYKTSAGAVLHTTVAQVPNLPAAIEKLKGAGFWVGGASEKAKDDIWSAPLDGRIALVAGSEGEGISRLVETKCDFMCALPQVGKIGSLNVAQATTTICYEWFRRVRPDLKGGE